MAILQLINEQEIKDLTSLGNNVDIKKLRHHITVAMDKYIKPAIGETCYDLLLDSVENDDPTADETTLLDGDDRSFSGIKAALAWWTLYEAYPDLYITTGNSTLQKKTSDTFETASLEEVEMLRRGAKSNAEYYTNYLIEYIQKNDDTYTCYSCTGITPLTDDIDSAGGFALDWDEVTRIDPNQEKITSENANG